MSAPDRPSRFPISRLRSGGSPGGPALRIAERAVALVQITARKGREAQLAATIRRHLGLALPEPCRSAAAGGRTALWLQPGGWLIEGPVAERGTLHGTLAASLKGLASVVDQSHGRAILTLSGERAGTVLAKLCRLDLHERSFAAGHCASTLVGHVGCLVHRAEVKPTFDLIVASTFAEWLLDEVAAASAPFGWQFVPAAEVAA